MKSVAWFYSCSWLSGCFVAFANAVVQQLKVAGLLIAPWLRTALATWVDHKYKLPSVRSHAQMELQGILILFPSPSSSRSYMMPTGIYISSHPFLFIRHFFGPFAIWLHGFWEDILVTVFHHSAQAYLGLCLWTASKGLYPRDLISRY